MYKAILFTVLGYASAQKLVYPLPNSGNPEPNDFNAVMETIAGMAIGFTGKQMPHLESCVEDSDEMVNLLVDAVDGFVEGSFISVARGFEDLSKFVSEIPVIAKTCPQTEADWESFSQVGEAFSSIGQFSYTVGENLVLNGHEIFQEWDDGLNFEKQGNHFMFGVKMGIAMDEAVQPPPIAAENELFLH